ncbi:hypothetical protein [Humisphaera borealis]|uniref:Uncharacterized protein n=1 Tax=Humisphaera borealis TaxID=2807512 RepID=A0A7M2WWT5_9BACT|nr:hypothetical protein [Humisphaera borealis]QOV89936.1 hypothetical protein IPV69_00760 [Humisphaera borealis]
MTRADEIPDPSALLCEGCGYTLHDGPAPGNCPECGIPISDSLPELRHPAPWEAGQGVASIGAWLKTTGWVLFAPRGFFRHLSAIGPTRKSSIFGHVYRLLTSLLLGLAASVHFDFLAVSQTSRRIAQLEVPGLPFAIAAVLTFLAIELISLAVVYLTAWEAGYRGLRLPRPIVARAIDYHAVHLVPPAILGTVTVLAYDWLNRHDGNLAAAWIMTYIYTLAAEVIVSAGYLFVTYWAAMRNLMYANAGVVSSR